MKSQTKRHFVSMWANKYAGLGPNVSLPAMPRLPKPGHVWTADGQEVPLVRAVWSGKRAADIPITEDIMEEDTDEH